MSEIDLSTLHLNPRNPRTISKDAFAKLCDSIRRDPEFMPLRPIVVDDSGAVLGGNQRLRACIAIGKTTVPASWVVKASTLTPEQRKRFTIIDNKPAGDWDDDVLSADYETDDLLAAGFTEQELFGLDEQPAADDCKCECPVCGKAHKKPKEKA